ncbi:MAG: FIST N-terminal domain-containing protein [Synechococcus sp.]|nr:FIST N-terminal domain-containing protein [Synechococcus sp.]
MLKALWNRLGITRGQTEAIAAPFQWLNALSTQASLEGAIDEVVSQIRSNLVGSADLAIVFISTAFASEYARVLPLLIEKLPCKVVIGCGGASIIGTDVEGKAQECEDQPALSLTVAHLPDVEVVPFQVTEKDLPDLDSGPERWLEIFQVSPEAEPNFILLADPFSSSITDLLAGLDFAYPHAPKVGGLTSVNGRMVSSLFYYVAGPENAPLVLRSGTIGVALTGNIKMETIVAQGCRPIGDVYQITHCDRNIITALTAAEDEGGKQGTPLRLLQELIGELDEEDQALAQDSLFIGIAMDEFKQKLIHGDFLIRNLLGVDPRAGAIAVGDRIRAGQRVQFHLRDAETSAEDLSVLLQRFEDTVELPDAFGALMFACLGRGKGLYGEQNFDSSLFSEAFPQPNLGGFFCNGEIGPVGDRTFLHGYTSVFGILHPKE